MRRRFVVVAAMAAVAGCTTSGTPAGSLDLSVAGVYRGALHIDTQDLPSELRVSENGSYVQVVLVTRDGLTAVGEGTSLDTKLRAGLDYDHGCPGRIVLSGELSGHGSTLHGLVRVADCTGRVAGTFEVERVPRTRVDAPGGHF
jgi:hypothetical protein